MVPRFVALVAGWVILMFTEGTQEKETFGGMALDDDSCIWEHAAFGYL